MKLVVVSNQGPAAVLGLVGLDRQRDVGRVNLQPDLKPVAALVACSLVFC